MHRLSLGSAKSVRELIHASVKASSEQRFLHRLHCVLLIAEGRSCYEVARWFGENPRTIERWVHAFDEHGVEGLREHHAGGRPTKLSRDQVQRLTLDLQKPPHFSGFPELQWSGKTLGQHLDRRFAIKLSARQCQRMICRLAGAGPPRVA